MDIKETKTLEDQMQPEDSASTSPPLRAAVITFEGTSHLNGHTVRLQTINPRTRKH